MGTGDTGRGIRRGRRSGAARRRGVATVELALVLPVLLILIFGTLEICQRLLLRESAAVAAYETARLAARRHATAEEAISRGLSILEGRGIDGGSVQLSPTSLVNASTGEELQVTVAIPIEDNTPVSYVLPAVGTITVAATMLRE